MKGKKRLLATLTSVAMLIGCIAMPVSADSSNVVTTWEELKDAIADTSVDYVKLGADITTDDVIDIPSGKNVSIDTNGYTIRREIYSQSASGHVFHVCSDAVLDITRSDPNRGHGTITGGFAINGGAIKNEGTLYVSYVDIINNNTGETTDTDNSHGGAIWNSGELYISVSEISGNKSDDGGGIFNTADGTIVFNGVSITGNTSLLHGGGGITNYGSLTFMSENTITGNTSKSNGGGVWNNGGFIIDRPNNKLVIKDNDSTAYFNDNLYLYGTTVITLKTNAELISGTEIYVSVEKASRKITYNWNAGENQDMVMAEGNMELGFSNGELTSKETYVKREWVDNKIKETSLPIPEGVTLIRTSDHQAVQDHLDNGAVRFQDCWILVDCNTVWEDFLAVYGTVNLVIKDDVTFQTNKGIEVLDGSTLNIYGQKADSGTIIAKAENEDDPGRAGIGGKEDNSNGNIVIHGGTITAAGATEGAGIGTGDEAGTAGGSIVIYGGTVTATGGKLAAGIGGGDGSTGGPITIYGGTVTANAGEQGAGIGSGEDTDSNNITIYGGKITANGGRNSVMEGGAGIGSGEAGENCATIKIYGGEIHANGGDGAPGIGSGSGASIVRKSTDTGTIEIHGGTVYAYGGCKGAGIGGGESSNSNQTILIEGGYVEAHAAKAHDQVTSSDGAAGIGAGCGGSLSGDFEGNITITGGTVKAYASGWIFDNYAKHPLGAAGIGGGYKGHLTGSVTISGGDVEAVGRAGGAAIGAGSECEQKGSVEIKGTAKVRLKIVDNEYANDYSHKVQVIGYGEVQNGNHSEQGPLTLGGNMMVWIENNDVVPADQRVETCRTNNRTYYWFYIEPCTHQGHTYTTNKTTHLEMCSYCDTTFQTEAHTFDQNGKCTVCGYQRVFPAYKGHSVLLKEGKIGLNFYMDLSGLTDEEKAGSYMKFDIAGKGEVTEQDNYDANSFVTLEGKTCNGFTAEIYAIQMADEITATFYYYQDGEWKTVVNTYSVKQYCDDFTDKWNKQESHSDADTKAKPLIEALADYGHYLQIYLKGIRGWNFDPENGYTEMSTVYTTYSDSELSRAYTETVGKKISFNNDPNSKIKAVTYSLNFDSETCINVYFEMNEGKDYNGKLWVSSYGTAPFWYASPGYPGELSTGETASLERLSDGRYRLKIKGIFAQNLNRDFTFVVSSDAEPEGYMAMITVSALSYVNALAADGRPEESKNAAAAFYRYYEATRDFCEGDE